MYRFFNSKEKRIIHKGKDAQIFITVLFMITNKGNKPNTHQLVNG